MHPADTSPSAPPPPPPPPPGFAPPPAAGTARPRRPWRDRLPEVAAGIGAVLVALAMAGFVSSTWEVLDELGKGVVLGAAAAGLTVAGLWGDRSGRGTFAAMVPMVWAAATATTVAAMDVVLGVGLPDADRVAIALAGVAGVAHAAVLWRRRPDALLGQLATVGAAVYAVGPVGTSLGDAYRASLLPELARPLLGLLDPSVASDAFVLVAAGHLVVAVAWLALARVLHGRPAHLARVGGSALVGYAAMEWHVLASPMGAVVALLVVLGYLAAGLVLDDVLLVVVGTVGALVSGVKVIWALFSGEVAVTLTVFAVGLCLLGWAYRAAQHRDDTVEA